MLVSKREMSEPSPSQRPIRIPFSKPHAVGTESHAVQEAIRTGDIGADGAQTKLCHQLLEQQLGVTRALLTTSCTHALEMAALLLQLKPGDEVIAPSYTFVSTINAFVLHGATPVFVDVRPDTLNLDEAQLEAAVTPRTRAIVPVHYAGVGCEMDAILDIAARSNLLVVEDNAHGLFGKYRGRYLGSLGQLGVQSFHTTKNFTCGEGGALLINDASYTQRAEILREKGTNRSQFLRGEVDKYTWRDVGSSYLPSGLLAAFLAQQLLHRERIQARRQEIFERYSAGLAAWARSEAVQLPTIPEQCEQSYHMFYMLLPTQRACTELQRQLRTAGIQAVMHYVPLHTSPMGARYGYRSGQLPITESVATRLLRLPFFNDLTSEQQDFVIDRVQSFRC